jgi:hypothetical protein
VRLFHHSSRELRSAFAAREGEPTTGFSFEEIGLVAGSYDVIASAPALLGIRRNVLASPGQAGAKPPMFTYASSEPVQSKFAASDTFAAWS